MSQSMQAAVDVQGAIQNTSYDKIDDFYDIRVNERTKQLLKDLILANVVLQIVTIFSYCPSPNLSKTYYFPYILQDTHTHRFWLKFMIN